MFRRLLLVFTDSELRTKILKIIGLLIAARFLAHVPIPVLDTQNISNLINNDQVFGLLNTISGGSYGRLSFVMLGVGPYITASIVMQLLGVIIPKIREIQKEEGQQGQQKVNRWTRFLVVPLAALNAWGILQFLAAGNPQTGGSLELPEVLTRSEINAETVGAWFAVIASMTAGSIAMMWIGEIISEFKMGNGISLIILSGIIVRLPGQVASLMSDFSSTLQDLFSRFMWSDITNWEVWKALLWQNATWEPLRMTLLLFTIFILTLSLVVFVNDAIRRIMVVYSRRGHSEGKSRTMQNVKADLPIKVNMAGILPIIFAVSFILFPTIVSRFFFTANIESLRDVAQDVETYLSTNPSQEARSEPFPNGALGFYGSSSAQEIQNASNYDSTEGQDLFGFTISTFQPNENFSLPENPSETELEKAAKQDVDNVLFDGTPLRLEFDSWNPGFLPEFAVYWDGVLAYTFFYFLLIIFFTYFYTATIAFKTDEVADNLQKAGAYIPGYRPGQQTMEYLSYVSNRLNVVGSVFLASIAVLPLTFQHQIQFGDGTLTGIVGGTTLLILVSVSMEVLKKIEAQATAVDYNRFTKY
jgi:preprotein translocase subunit SecY